MASSPKITIITPSYNQGHFIEETITSVLSQGYANLEYIIVDGGSTDNTVEIIKKYEKHLAYWVSEKDSGQSEAINKGYRLATGEIINWLNSDDYYMPGTFQHVSGVFADKNITAYCGKSRVFSATKEYVSQGTDVYPNNLAKTIGWARIDQPETFFRKSVWDTIGELNQDFHFVMDKEWWIRYLLHYGLDGIVKDNQVLVNFRIHESSKTGSQLSKFNLEILSLYYSLIQIVQKTDGFFDGLQTVTKPLTGYSNADSKLIMKAVNYHKVMVMLEAYAQNDYELSKKAYLSLNLKEIDKKDAATVSKVWLKLRLLPRSFKKYYNQIIKK